MHGVVVVAAVVVVEVVIVVVVSLDGMKCPKCILSGV